MDQGHAFGDEAPLPFLEHGGADTELSKQEQATGQAHADRK